MKNTGVIRKIDSLGRIVIPKEIRKNLNIHNGEDVQIYIEEDKIILKKYQKVLTIKENATKYLENFAKLFKGDVLITDKEKVIVDTKNNFIDKVIDSKIKNMIEERKIESGHIFNLNEESVDKYYYLVPIIVDADAIGAIMGISDFEISNEDKLLIQVLNILINMEFY